MPILLDKIDEIKNDSSVILEKSKETILESVDNIDIDKNNLPLDDNTAALFLAIVVAIIVLAKPLYGPILMLLRIGLIMALGYFALIFLVLS